MKILIIDDEPGLASGLAKALKDCGPWDCLSAGSAGEAVDLMGSDPEIRVVVSDVVMADSDGFTLRDSLLPNFPGLKFIFISGYDLSAYADRFAGTPLLMKPIAPEHLGAQIREIAGIPAVAPSAPVSSQPTAVPKVTASPQPTAVPQVRATPKATPQVSATPRPVPSASPKAVPAKAAGTPVPAASPKAVPAQVAARPAVKVASAPKASAPSASEPAAPQAAGFQMANPGAATAVELPPDALVGTTIGVYHIEAKIGENASGGIYRASQTNMNRPVRFYTLGAAQAASPGSESHFIANASVKANVRHPAMLAVYEASQGDGISFYACEYVNGLSLEEIAQSGQKIAPITALKILETTADVMGYFAREKIRHNRIRPGAILLDSKNSPRLANLAVQDPDDEVSATDEMVLLADMLRPLIAPGPLTPAVLNLLNELSSPQTNSRSWASLAQDAKALVPQSAPKDAYKLDARERAAIQTLEEAKRRQKKMLVFSSLGSLSLLAVILVVAYFVIFSDPKGRDFDVMLEIPAGDFTYQADEKVNLPTFWIDQYEVTIGQYAKFLTWVKENPEEAAKLAHPEMPKGKSHYPIDWQDQELATGPMLGYYARAKRYGRYKGAPLNVDSPVFGVDWFDAYAYAAWKGRRLPTEQEWEKAARGAEGLVYPWGNELNTKWVNSGADASPKPDTGGQIDGYSRSSPVDKKGKDKSPYGVMGMGGNVSEWTSTWAESPELGDKVPVIRGGNWYNPDVDTRRRLLRLSPMQGDMTLGFRTASDTPPKSDK